MRRPLFGALGAAALVVALVPVAVAKTVPVDGNRFAKAGLTALSQGCVDRRAVPVTAPDLKIRKGPGDAPIGSHAEGWQTHGTGFGAGWTGHVKRPAGLSRFRVQLFSPSQEAHGHAVAYFHPEGDTGYWFGNHDLGADTRKGWHSVNAANAVFTWTHYNADDMNDRTGADNTIADHVRQQGGNGNGADLGFVFGCDENVFYVDKMELFSNAARKTFDFGGFRTRGQMWLGETRPDQAVLLYGYELRISGTLHEKAGGDRVAGVLKFEAKPLGGGRWRQVGKDRAGASAKASTVVQPKRSTVYRVRYSGVDRYQGSVSDTLKVIIRNKVAAHLVDSTVTKGQSFAVAGSVKPAKKTRILLQRFVGGKWRTVKKGSTGGDGGFRIGAVAGDAGGSYWRIKTLDGGGTQGNVSQNMKLTVKQPADSPNPPPPDDPEPPPPPPPPPPPEG